MIFAKLWPKYVETCKMWVNQNYIKCLRVIIRDTRINTFLKHGLANCCIFIFQQDFLRITFMVAADNPLINSVILAAALQEHTVLIIQGSIEGPVPAFGDASADICTALP